MVKEERLKEKIILDFTDIVLMLKGFIVEVDYLFVIEQLLDSIINDSYPSYCQAKNYLSSMEKVSDSVKETLLELTKNIIIRKTMLVRVLREDDSEVAISFVENGKTLSVIITIYAKKDMKSLDDNTRKEILESLHNGDFIPERIRKQYGV